MVIIVQIIRTYKNLSWQTSIKTQFKMNKLTEKYFFLISINLNKDSL